MKVKLNPDKLHMHEGVHFTLNKEYFVIGKEYNLWRVIDDNMAKPALYFPDLFIIVNPTHQDNWIVRKVEDNFTVEYPEELSERGFFDRYWDGDPNAKKIYRKYLEKLGLMSSTDKDIPNPRREQLLAELKKKQSE